MAVGAIPSAASGGRCRTRLLLPQFRWKTIYFYLFNSDRFSALSVTRERKPIYLISAAPKPKIPECVLISYVNKIWKKKKRKIEKETHSTDLAEEVIQRTPLAIPETLRLYASQILPLLASINYNLLVDGFLIFKGVERRQLFESNSFHDDPHVSP